MTVDERNQLLLEGNLDRAGLWPKLREYESRRFQFRWEFGLETLPTKRGIITIRGARQSGKSTWLEFQVLKTIEKFGPGTAFFLNGDDIYSHEEFETKLLKLENSFPKAAKIRRVFIDEITQIKDWERVLKRLIDRGDLKNTLVVTTGSNASDLRRGSERLPGRKGELERTEYIFLPISYTEYCYQTQGEIGTSPSDRLWGYILTGGAPLAIHELYNNNGSLSETFTTLISDWILGDFASSGRSRIFLLNLLRKLFQAAPSPISYTRLAQEAGLANNTAALDYVEKLGDLLCLKPMMRWDPDKDVVLARKACKIPFINLAVAWTFHPKAPRSFKELKELSGLEKGAMFEWVVAQELWRQEQLKLQTQKKRPSIQLFETELSYWASNEHEIDFVSSERNLYEVKAGPSSPSEFHWFPKVFPKKKLIVISESQYETERIKGITLEQFLT